MFDKILIANRGEIACRVIACAKSLGVSTVAVFSDADREALHVGMVDEAVHIGPALAEKSYLCGEKIIAAAKHTGAQAIHPGYGFLSENPEFAEAVEAAGLVFIGPPAAAIRAMGLKDAAKNAMQKASVPVVPGVHGKNQEPKFLASKAEKIGYPVLIKARAGGGGKGIRRVDAASEFIAALEGAKRESKASFGDPHCLIEKFIAQARHIEIQIFGDNQGHVVHMFERDCSLQRRHQKVIEEAPAPGMSQEMRRAMGEAAVRAAKAIGYWGAGTIEFIADVSDGLRPERFYFMEMNTRLQVEHRVTEAITGLDLVALQLRVAAGESLPFKQDDLTISGHAIEARIYAEDAANGFLPATGRITHLRFPGQCDGLRIDTGIREGDDITPYYDPMIAKLIVHGADRDYALAQLQAALREIEIAGVVTNTAFLGQLAASSTFAAGDADTGFIDKEQKTLTALGLPSGEAVAIAALAGHGHIGGAHSTSLRGFRAWGRAEQTALFEREGECFEVKIGDCGAGCFEITAGADMHCIGIVSVNENRVNFTIDGRVCEAGFAKEPGAVTVFLDGATTRFERYSAEAHSGDAPGGDRIAAPMPGLVKLVATAPGKQVAKGEVLVVLEAMKMEYSLKAPRDGAIAELLVAAGDQVENGALLLVLTPEKEL